MTLLVRPDAKSAVETEESKLVLIGAVGIVEDAIAAYSLDSCADWILHLDPDEIWNDALVDSVFKMANELRENEAAEVPFQFLVGDYPLGGGPWGGERFYRRLNSTKCWMSFVPAVHNLPDSVGVRRVAGGVAVQHMWVSSLEELRIKHEKYLRVEGAARLARHGAFTYRAGLTHVARVAAGCIRSRAWVDGKLGWRLAGEMIRYQACANWEWLSATRKSKQAR